MCSSITPAGTCANNMTKLQRHTQRQHPLWQLTLMRWWIFVREPSALFWTYGFPVVLALALGVAFRDRPPEPVEVAVEATPGCEAWLDALATNSEVHVRWLNPQEAREALRVGKVSVVVGQAANPPRRDFGRRTGEPERRLQAAGNDTSPGRLPPEGGVPRQVHEEG